MNTETFVVPKSFYEPIKDWSNEDLGALFRAIFEWQTSGVEYSVNDKIGLAFGLFKAGSEMISSLAIAKPKAKSRKATMTKEQEESVERIYKAYPAVCPIKGSRTGKSKKSKEKILTALNTYSEEHILKAISIYINDKIKTGRYLQNFNTFLNNIPDIEDDSKGITMNNSKVIWHITPTNNRRTGTKEQFEADKKRFGENNIKFIGNAV